MFLRPVEGSEFQTGTVKKLPMRTLFIAWTGVEIHQTSSRHRL